MKTILLGQNKIPVPAIIQGTMRFDRLTTNEVAAMFHNNLENGTNFVDTANCYGKPEGLVKASSARPLPKIPACVTSWCCSPRAASPSIPMAVPITTIPRSTC